MTTVQDLQIHRKDLGSTGVKIPEIGIGTYLYHGSSEIVRLGIDLGARFVDTAELYGNEEVVGRAIKGIRDQVFIATKTHHFRYEDVLQCAEASLIRLGIDTIDLYQLHHANAAVPIEETMAAFEKLVEQGKVRYLGVSNFTVPEFIRAEAALKKNHLVANQVRYSVIDRTVEKDLLPFCQKRNVTLIAYSPLGHSFQHVLAADKDGVLGKVARETGKTQAQIALSWCLAKAGVVVIPKTESPQHMAENCASSGWHLTAEQLALVDAGVRCRRRSRVEVAFRRFVRRSVQKLRGR